MQDLDKLIKELEAGTKEIEQERAKAEALFLSIGDGAIVTDEHARIQQVNQTTVELLGFSENELLDEWYPKAIIAENEDEKEISQIDRPITKAFLTGESTSAQYFYKRKDGSKIPVAVTVSPVILDAKPIGAIEVFRDITKEYEVDKMKSEFISIASHQLRTPVTALKNSAQMFSQGYLGDLDTKQKEFVDVMLQSIFRMQELISTLLNITRIEAGRIAINPKPTNISEIIQQIIKELDSKAKEKNINVTLKASPNLPTLQTDPLLAKEVFANLLSNAIKYSPKSGAVSIELSADKTNDYFSIKDSGYGIPVDEQKRIFSKFFRGSNIVKKESVGTGLGLYMVKLLVDNLGGKIWFKSQEGKGTEFYVGLPIKGITKKEGATTIEETTKAAE